MAQRRASKKELKVITQAQVRTLDAFFKTNNMADIIKMIKHKGKTFVPKEINSSEDPCMYCDAFGSEHKHDLCRACCAELRPNQGLREVTPEELEDMDLASAPAVEDPTKPGYYNDSTGRDVIAAFIESQGLPAFEAAALFNIEKYLRRAGKKPGEAKEKDLRKAAEYLQRWLKELKQATTNEPANE